MGALIDAEADDLARLTSTAYQRAVAYYRASGHSAVEADTLARDPLPTVADAPAHEVSWYALNTLLDSDPAMAIAIWERVKIEAAGYVAGGSHIAEGLAYDTPWQRAQFLVIRQAFYEDWKPTGAVEGALLDSMAHSFLMYLHWSGQVQERGTSNPRSRGDGWEVPLQTTADAIDQAAQMADRFNRLMVRTLRALRDLRRYTVVINNNGGQVNVAGQQINATRIEQEAR